MKYLSQLKPLNSKGQINIHSTKKEEGKGIYLPMLGWYDVSFEEVSLEGPVYTAEEVHAVARETRPYQFALDGKSASLKHFENLSTITLEGLEKQAPSGTNARSPFAVQGIDTPPATLFGDMHHLLAWERIFGFVPRDLKRSGADRVSLLQVREALKFTIAGEKKYGRRFSMKHMNRWNKVVLPEIRSLLPAYDQTDETNPHDYRLEDYLGELKFHYLLATSAFDDVGERLFLATFRETVEEKRKEKPNEVPTNTVHGNPFAVYVKQDDFSMLQTAHSRIHSLLHHIDVDMSKPIAEWYARYYKNSRMHTLNGLVTWSEEDTFPWTGEWAFVSSKLTEFKSRGELALVKTMLLQKQIKWEELSCELNIPTHTGDVTIRLLDAKDPLSLSLGQLTHCCQSIGNAGETCVLEGIANPHSGFVVFEKDNHVIAQAWVWEDSNGGLVLDNIEFGNFRGIGNIEADLKQWLESLPYENVQMGIGYSELRVGETVRSRDIHWLKAYTYVEKNDLYSDADNRTWLKQDGAVYN